MTPGGQEAGPPPGGAAGPVVAGPLCRASAVELAGLLRRREVAAREVLAEHLAAIEAVDPAINAVVTRCFERARDEAAAADQRAARGEPLGPLHGLPLAVKDLHDTAGVRTTRGSLVYADHVPTADAAHVARLRAAGAIMVGKTNTPKFGAGSHTFNAVFGVTRNPYRTDRSAGGSSGGSAAALAARLVPLADGSDMGGSLRNPASFCNVVGLRPSAGRVATWPVADPWNWLPVVGPMGRTAADVALLLGVLAVPDPRVPGSLDSWQSTAGPLRPLAAGLRVAVSPDLGGLPVDPAVRAVLATAPATLTDLGATVIERDPDLAGADDAFRVLRAFSFAHDFAGLLPEHRDVLKATVVWNIEAGLRLAVGDLHRAVSARTRLAQAFAELFTDVDVLACPVSQVPPFPVEQEWVGEIDGRPMATYLDWMASAYLFSVTGLPAASVPFGFTPDGLPVGLQLVGPPRSEARLLALAAAIEEAVGAVGRRPGVVAG